MNACSATRVHLPCWALHVVLPCSLAAPTYCLNCMNTTLCTGPPAATLLNRIASRWPGLTDEWPMRVWFKTSVKPVCTSHIPHLLWLMLLPVMVALSLPEAKMAPPGPIAV